MKLLVWNINWATPTSRKGRIIAPKIAAGKFQVVCLPETEEGMLPSGGQRILGGDNWGYKREGARRKIALWSSAAWTDVIPEGPVGMPPGRFISGVSHGIRFIGVCIPWKDAHVTTGNKNRDIWEEHGAYLKKLRAVVVAALKKPQPICLIGDFNQRIPRVSQSKKAKEVADALQEIIDLGLEVITAEKRDAEGDLLIDHMALGAGLRGAVETIWPNIDENGLKLSDHVGVGALMDGKLIPLFVFPLEPFIPVHGVCRATGAVSASP